MFIIISPGAFICSYYYRCWFIPVIRVIAIPTRKIKFGGPCPCHSALLSIFIVSLYFFYMTNTQIPIEVPQFHRHFPIIKYYLNVIWFRSVYSLSLKVKENWIMIILISCPILHSLCLYNPRKKSQVMLWWA